MVNGNRHLRKLTESQIKHEINVDFAGETIVVEGWNHAQDALVTFVRLLLIRPVAADGRCKRQLCEDVEYSVYENGSDYHESVILALCLTVWQRWLCHLSVS